MALTGGLRASEALGLRWDALDLDSGLVKVRQAVEVNADKHPAVKPYPKTRSSRRNVRLPAFALDHLRFWRQRQRERRMFLGSEWTETGLVCPAYHGQVRRVSDVSRYWGEFRAKHPEFPKMRFHDLRHSLATIMQESLDIADVSKLLGHSSIAITSDIYVGGDDARERWPGSSGQLNRVLRWFTASHATLACVRSVDQ